MNRTAALIICSFLLIQCASKKNIVKSQFKTPPGSVKIKKGIYVDRSEISISGFREYFYDLKAIFGENSTEYNEAVIYLESCKYQPYIEFDESNYCFNGEYDYPVVGITYDQAVSFSNWRSDKVAEMLLIKKGYIGINKNRSREDHFTIQSYLDGSYAHILVHDTTVVFPEYRIPSLAEWKMFSKKNDFDPTTLIANNRHNRLEAKKYGIACNTLERYEFKIESDSSYNHFMVPIRHRPFRENELAFFGDKNEYGLYNIVGNVSELVEGGKIVGGNWLSNLKDLNIMKAHNVNMPNCYTGFRNICYYDPD